jgi:TatA/E family protein of Tat protein translocase
MLGMRPFEVLLIFLAIVLLFGASRLPQLGSSLGQAIRNFKRGFGEATGDSADEKKDVGTLPGGDSPEAKATAGKVGSRDA